MLNMTINTTDPIMHVISINCGTPLSKTKGEVGCKALSSSCVKHISIKLSSSRINAQRGSEFLQNSLKWERPTWHVKESASCSCLWEWRCTTKLLLTNMFGRSWSLAAARQRGEMTTHFILMPWSIWLCKEHTILQEDILLLGQYLCHQESEITIMPSGWHRQWSKHLMICKLFKFLL